MVVVPSRVQADKSDILGEHALGGVNDHTVTNGIYTVTVGGVNASSPGMYTVSTGASHPNPNRNILYGGGSQAPGSTYNTVRFYSTGSTGFESTGFEYCPGGPTASTGYTSVNINNTGVVKSVTPAGNAITATWNLTGSSTGPQPATVTQVTAVEGTTFADSRVRFTTTVTNNNGVGGASLLVGIRYLWDLQIANRDTAIFQQLNPASAWLDVETTSIPPGYTNYQITDYALTPTFVVQGSVSAPPFTPAPTPPARVSYANWYNSYVKAFDYVTGSGSAGDSALLFYWGGTGGMGTPVGGIPILPGASYSVTQYLYTTSQPTPTVAPTVTAVNPDSGTQGQCPMTVIIRGTNFTGATAVSFGTGITVNSFTVNSAAQITATICIAAGTAPGARDVSVTTAGGTGTLRGGFTVWPNLSMGQPQSSSGGGATGTYAAPVALPSLVIQSASLSAKAVTPGTPVTVTADIANKSTVNGNKKVTLYVNGQVETTQAVTVNSGGSSKLTFNVSRSEPGDYTIYVDGVPAGSFKVELFRESDGILIFSAALVAIAFLIGIVMLWRRQRAGR
jgi:primosomal replication protein N